VRHLPASLIAAVAPALAACADAPAAGGPDEAAAVAACAAATAEHVGKPVEAVAAVWDGPTPDGGATVDVTDAAGSPGERTHVCVVRPDGSLVALLHPDA
jgi:hypothetical protein